MKVPVVFTEIPLVRSALSDYPVLLNAEDETHIKVFRKIIEWSMTQGRWAGWYAGVS